MINTTPDTGRITRRQFIKSAGVTAGAVAAGGPGFSGVARSVGPGDPNITKDAEGLYPATGGEHVIYLWPQNDPLRDALNIQWAVDNVALNGAVFLKAVARGTQSLMAFNLGLNMVALTRDVTITGENPLRVAVDSLHQKGRQWLTMVINGGFQQFYTPAKTRGFRLTVKNIEFFRPGTGYGPIQNLFRIGRHHLKAVHHRLLRDRAFSDWRESTCAC